MAEIEQENLLEGKVIAQRAQTEEKFQANQIVLPKEAELEIAELERQYRETIGQENK